MKKLFLILIVILSILPTISAIALTTSPAMDSTTTVSSTQCASSTASLPFTITNTGDFGVLCYYYTNEDGTYRPLFTTCLRKNQTGTYNASFTPPASGTKNVTVSLECYDIKQGLWSDGCVDGTSYDIAKANHYSCSSPGRVWGCQTDSRPRYAQMTCASIDFSLSSTGTSVSLLCGTNTTIQAKVSNNMNDSLNCSYTQQGGSGGAVGVVAAHGEQSFPVTISAPSNCQGSTSADIAVKCEDPAQGNQSTTKTLTITVNYVADTAKAAIADATSTVNNATSELGAAQSKIQEASNLGAVVTDAQNKLNQAQSFLNTAKTELSTAQSTYTAGNIPSATSQANQAKADAQAAKNFASDAYSAANNAVTVLEKEKKDAADLIDQCKSGIAEAQSWVDRANSTVNTATKMGMDTVSAKANVETAKGDLSNANSYYSQASSAFSSKNYSVAKQNANSALSNSTDAENLAKQAHNSFSEAVEKAKIASDEMDKAQTEISQADQTYVKLTQVVREMRKYGKMAETLTSIDEEKATIDEAKDFYSQAENKFSAGYYEQAVNAATQARDTAASSRNRLDRITENLRYNLLDALDAAKNSAQTEVAKSNTAIENASATYGATAEKIVDAQNTVKEANIQFQTANSLIDQAKVSTSLTELLNAAASAFDTINTGVLEAQDATNKANSAVSDVTATAVGTAVVVVGAAGGGYLFWKKRKGKKAGKPGEKTGVVKELKEKHPKEVEWQQKGNKLKEELKKITGQLQELDEKLVDGKISNEEHDKNKKAFEEKKAKILKKI